MKQEFSALLDGELTPEKRAAIEAHLAESAEDLRELDGYKRVDALFRGLPREEAPEELEKRLETELRRGPLQFTARRLHQRQVWPLLSAAAMFLLVCGTALYFSIGGPESPSYEVASLGKDVAQQAAVESELAEEAMPAAEGAASVAEEPLPELQKVADDRMASSQGALGRTMAKIAPADEAEYEDAAELPSESPTALPASPAPEAVKEEIVVGVPLEQKQQEAAMSQRRMEREAPARGVSVDADEAREQDISDTAARKTSAVVTEQERLAKEMTPPKPAAKPPAQSAAFGAMKKADARAFEQRDGGWFQTGYGGEPTQPLPRDDVRLAEWIKVDSELAQRFEAGTAVVFRVDDTWYRVEAAE